MVQKEDRSASHNGKRQNTNEEERAQQDSLLQNGKQEAEFLCLRFWEVTSQD